jgi:hypothetical protein
MPRSRVKVNPSFGGKYCLNIQDRRASLLRASCMVSCLGYSWTLKIKGICSSETPANFHRTTRSYIPEDQTFSVYHCWGLIALAVCRVILLGMSKLAASPLHPQDPADPLRYCTDTRQSVRYIHCNKSDSCMPSAQCDWGYVLSPSQGKEQ